MDVSTISIPILALSSDQCLQANKSCEKSKDAALVHFKSNDDGGEYSMMLPEEGSQCYSRVVYTVRSFLLLLHSAPVWVRVVWHLRGENLAAVHLCTGVEVEGGSEVRKIGFLEES